ncbi:hypothetical protein I7I50_06765 [Histoplasma capsulatum G186AR]|uniref:Uncharacterized protein n=1 Tax=Ajellomyces capsulatus TaxID=5037 RepID=A0A8H7Z204_AJECA|nr:hypothetical protein I7I52_10160 [Histoplasma capsulatum]QSS67628.1 hypothetical protein I7I50_06765 [Histoplasma capsulatum G186AR]
MCDSFRRFFPLRELRRGFFLPTSTLTIPSEHYIQAQVVRTLHRSKYSVPALARLLSCVCIGANWTNQNAMICLVSPALEDPGFIPSKKNSIRSKTRVMSRLVYRGGNKSRVFLRNTGAALCFGKYLVAKFVRGWLKSPLHVPQSPPVNALAKRWKPIQKQRQNSSVTPSQGASCILRFTDSNGIPFGEFSASTS